MLERVQPAKLKPLEVIGQVIEYTGYGGLVSQVFSSAQSDFPFTHSQDGSLYTIADLGTTGLTFIIAATIASVAGNLKEVYFQ